MYFCIPFVPRERCLDWDRAVGLLKNTLRTVARQRSRHFSVLICAHDDLRSEDFGGLAIDWIQPDWQVSEARGGGRDKYWKLQMLGAEVRRRGGGHVMPLDADDLLSERLVEAVHAIDDPNGIVLTTGYMMDAESGQLAPLPGAWPKPFDFYCGSCAIFNMAPEDLPEDRQDEDCRWGRLKSHHVWKRMARDEGRPLTPMPFAAAVYVQNNGVNLHDRRNKERNDLARRSIRAAAIEDDAAIRQEFGLA
jgi:hypothetical protein